MHDYAIAVFGKDRVLLNPDCGVATFADDPVSTFAPAEHEVRAIVEVGTTLD